MHKEAALESLRTNPTDDQEEASMDARIGHRVLAQDATTSPCTVTAWRSPHTESRLAMALTPQGVLGPAYSSPSSRTRRAPCRE